MRIPNQDDRRLYPMGRFIKFVFRISGRKNLEILAADPNTGGPNSFTVKMKYLLLFNSDIGNFVWKTEEGEEEGVRKHCFVNFCTLALL